MHVAIWTRFNAFWPVARSALWAMIQRERSPTVATPSWNSVRNCRVATVAKQAANTAVASPIANEAEPRKRYAEKATSKPGETGKGNNVVFSQAGRTTAGHGLMTTSVANISRKLF